MYIYEHRVKYYETDKMGVTHHSNYIRFMEEARVEWLDHIGCSYKKCEDMGVSSPVLSINCQYKHNTTFDDIIDIKVYLKNYNGLRLTVGYEMKKNNEIVVIGESEHCFINQRGVPIRLKKEFPEIDEILKKELETEH